ncbi:alpha-mannosidase [Leptothoe sp. PORK10 BA2]|uniref:alpha-mannosidase n=1 Tax=Leptothoe sp. PORK10 BA2 TaxID=3110254 RepID=UPI002B1ED622|nr:alpha-mannosidase [Leptothoe sp. PORK10 BA2]MEA5463855.1 alpha-mannosidase [Leptothoe sp. PORK10 BA2]
MNASTPFLTNLIQELRTYSQQDVQMHWHGLYDDRGGDLSTAMAHGARWDDLPLNERQHIAWPHGRVLWLYQRFTVPEALNGYPVEGLTLRLATAWWAEDAQLYVNGEWVQGGDLFDFFVRPCLSDAVVPGQEFDVVLRLESPKHDAGALVRSHLIYEAPNHPLSPEPGFVADELEVLQYYLQSLAPEKLPDVEALITQEWPASRGELHQRLANLRQCLLPHGDWVKQRQIHCVGHAHLDLAWLWPVADTWRAAERTFQSVLALQQDFPELTYTHSSPALFAWLEVHRPELFHQVQQQVTAGKWSIDAGLWVEPELNIVSGESIARQILYGQRYCQEKFGGRSLIAWLPDTFGFCSQLPQLLKLGGVEVFATQKLRWNDTTQFPHELFRWQSPDGSQVLGWTLPPIGTDFDPVKMAAYAVQWEEKTKSPHTCWLPGVGDHGGGPTRDMLIKARRWAESPFFPSVKFSTPGQFLHKVLDPAEPANPIEWERFTTSKENLDERAVTTTKSAINKLPLWDDELYLELHRGCYTTHSDQKQQNRRGEDLLYQAELWATVAHLVAAQPYPKEKLEIAWKALLFNQFHDILPGTSIPEVFDDANRDWAQVQQLGQAALGAALESLATTLVVPAGMQPLVVFNAQGWTRTELVEVVVPPGPWRIVDCETHQAVQYGEIRKDHPFEDAAEVASQTLSFVAEDVPAVGYRLYGLVADEPEAAVPKGERATPAFVLDNGHLRVVISPDTGEIISCIHLATGRESFWGAANQLQCFADSGQYWDAWNIAPNYGENPCDPAVLLSMQWQVNHSICQRLRVTRRLNQSTIVQDYVLAAQSPVLQVETWVDWQETQVVLKVNFPVTAESDHATYEVPFGAIARPTQPITDHDKAKWEVPALRWADLSDDTFGVSILTDCKHGFDAQPRQLRLTLLKAPLWPDPGCDRGYHHFTYAIYPHPGNWQTAHTPHQAQALNIPLQTYLSPAVPSFAPGAEMPARQSFLSLDSENFMLAAFKPSETNPAEFIVRYYDAYGVLASHQATPITNTLGLAVDSALNLLEEPMESGDGRPYQIHTHRLRRHSFSSHGFKG